MVRPVMLLLGAIPILVAISIVVPQLMKPETPTSVNSNDIISLEYDKQHLKKVSFGLTESLGAEKTEILTIQNDGQTTYQVTESGYSKPDVKYQLDKSELTKLAALIKDSGFTEIPSNSFPVKSDALEYDKFGLQVTLNGKSVNLQWAEQNASQDFIPPIITQVQSELEGIVTEIIN